MKLDFIDKLYNRMLPLWGTDKKVKIYPVNFDNPWWKILFKFKFRISLLVFLELIFSSFNTLFPILTAWSISTREVRNYFLIIALLLTSLVYRYIREYLYLFMSSSVLASVNNSANQFFLAVDPHYHSTRSSGQIISKVTRGVNSYESALDFIVYNVLSSISGLVSVIWALSLQSGYLGFMSGIFLFLIVTVSTIINVFITNKISKYRIKEEDKLKELTVENLQEVLLIRSSFATDMQVEKVERQSKTLIKHQVNSWMMSTLFYQITSFIYIFSLGFMGYLVFGLLQMDTINAITAVALLATYSGGASGLVFIGFQINRVAQNVKNIQDLFDFIRGFGKQTYPVLLTDNHENYEK